MECVMFRWRHQSSGAVIECVTFRRRDQSWWELDYTVCDDYMKRSNWLDEEVKSQESLGIVCVVFRWRDTNSWDRIECVLDITYSMSILSHYNPWCCSVCCSVSQFVAVCVAACCSVEVESACYISRTLCLFYHTTIHGVAACVAVCCSVCCSVLQRGSRECVLDITYSIPSFLRGRVIW